MRRLTSSAGVGLALAAVLAAVASGGGAASSGVSACRPGPKMVRGARVVVFCGPARATVKLGRTKLAFRHGSCVRGVNGAWAINVGTVTLPPRRPRFKHFGITIGRLRGPGKYKKAAIGFQWRGRTYGVTGSVVTIKGRVSSGTFTGRLDRGPRSAVRGSFSC